MIEIAIVEELPENCIACNHSYDITCELMFERLDCTRFDKRPNWCPLRTYDQAFEWMMNQPATPFVQEYFETVLNKYINDSLTEEE